MPKLRKIVLRTNPKRKARKRKMSKERRALFGKAPRKRKRPLRSRGVTFVIVAFARKRVRYWTGFTFGTRFGARRFPRVAEANRELRTIPRTAIPQGTTTVVVVPYE